MTTQPTNTFMINTNMNIRMNITQIQGRIDYVDNNVNIEPGRDKEKYSGGLYTYVENKVDT